MSTKNWKNQELKSLLTEKWGFKMDLSKLKLNEDKDMLISKIQALVDEERFSQRQGSEAIQSVEKTEKINLSKKKPKANTMTVMVKKRNAITLIAKAKKKIKLKNTPWHQKTKKKTKTKKMIH